MKFLKIALIVLGAIIVLYLAMGLFKSSVEYGSEIVTNKSVEEAWAVSQDESKYDQWLDGFKSMELIEGEHAQPGSKYRIIVNPGEGQEDFEMIETLISIKEYEHVEMHFDSDMMDFEQTIRFAETEEGSRITTESKVLGKGVMMRAMFGWMEMLFGSFTAQETKNQEALRELINANTTDYFPAPVEMMPDTMAVDSMMAEGEEMAAETAE